jgi:hypothetical protein
MISEKVARDVSEGIEELERRCRKLRVTTANFSRVLSDDHKVNVPE